MKRKELIGLHCHSDNFPDLKGIVKDIVRDDKTEKWFAVVEISKDKTTSVFVEDVIFDIPQINFWRFEYLNSSSTIDGDEKFHTEEIWLDAKISKESVTEMLTQEYASDKYFTLRNLHIVEQKTKDLILTKRKQDI